MFKIDDLRFLMKGYSEKHVERGPIPDQQKGVPHPHLEEPWDDDGHLIYLPDPADYKPVKNDVKACIDDRISHRIYQEKEISLLQLSFLLWATQGIKHISKNGTFFRRTVPSGGSRHPFETYLAITQVEGITPGIYRFIASQNALLLIHLHDSLPDAVAEMACEQSFCGSAGVFFIWTAVPYRTEWRYSSYAMKGILLDAGHVCQNLYLACEAAGLGTCGIAAYVQEKADHLIGVNGEDEFSIYMAPVGYSG